MIGTTDLENSERAHYRIANLLKRQGIRAIPRDTPEGELIAKLIDDLSAIASPKLPAISKEIIIETLVSAIILQRSAMTHLLRVGEPSVSKTEQGKARRQAYQLASTTFKSTSPLILNCLKQLGVQENETPKTLQDFLREFTTSQEVEAEFHEER